MIKQHISKTSAKKNEPTIKLSRTIAFICLYIALLPPLTVITWNENKAAVATLILSLLIAAAVYFLHLNISKNFRLAKNQIVLKFLQVGWKDINRQAYEKLVTTCLHPQTIIEQLINIFTVYVRITFIAGVYVLVAFVIVNYRDENLLTYIKSYLLSTGFSGGEQVDVFVRIHFTFFIIVRVLVARFTRFKLGFENSFRKNLYAVPYFK